MPKPRRVLVCVFFAALAVFMAAGAPGTAYAIPPDPSSNFAAEPTCSSPDTCVQKAIGYLDQARAAMGQPPYSLPTNFSELTAAEQAFVLTNLDRLLYGLAPIPGLTSQLDDAAAVGVQLDSDPVVSDPTVVALNSNWGGGYQNMLLAYAAWMYDDGPGGANVDCTATNNGGCWDHRHNILASFDSGAPVAMGAAAGTDPAGTPSFTMLLVQYDTSVQPTYVYTWHEAVAAGANGGEAATTEAHAANLGAPTTIVTITHLRVRGHAVWFHIIAPPDARPHCSLRRRAWGTRYDLARPCSAVTVFRRLAPGTYRLRVSAEGQTATRYLVVR